MIYKPVEFTIEVVEYIIHDLIARAIRLDCENEKTHLLGVLDETTLQAAKGRELPDNLDIRLDIEEIRYYILCADLVIAHIKDDRLYKYYARNADLSFTEDQLRVYLDLNHERYREPDIAFFQSYSDKTRWLLKVNRSTYFTVMARKNLDTGSIEYVIFDHETGLNKFVKVVEYLEDAETFTKKRAYEIWDGLEN